MVYILSQQQRKFVETKIISESDRFSVVFNATREF